MNSRSGEKESGFTAFKYSKKNKLDQHSLKSVQARTQGRMDGGRKEIMTKF